MGWPKYLKYLQSLPHILDCNQFQIGQYLKVKNKIEALIILKNFIDLELNSHFNMAQKKQNRKLSRLSN